VRGGRSKLTVAVAVLGAAAAALTGGILALVLMAGSGSVSQPCTSNASTGDPVSIGGASWAQQIDHLYPRVTIGQTGATLAPDVIAALAESAGKTLGINVPGWTMEQVTLGESSRRPGSFGNDPNGVTSGWGLWAITTIYNDAQVAAYGGYPGMLDPIANALVMAEIYQSQGVGAWYGSEYVTDWNKHYTGPLPLVNLKDLLANPSSGTSFVANQTTTADDGQCSGCPSDTGTQVATLSAGAIQTEATTVSDDSGAGGSPIGGYYFAEPGTSSAPGRASFATAHRLGDLFFEHRGAPPTLGGDAGTAQPLPMGAQVQVTAPNGRTLVVTKREIGSGAPQAAIDLTPVDAQALGLGYPSETQVTVKLVSLHGGGGSGKPAGLGGSSQPASYTGGSPNPSTGSTSCALDIGSTPGSTAKILASGYAVAPANAPPIVRQALAEGNRILQSNYSSAYTRGPLQDVLPLYDCSGGSAFVLYNTRYGTENLDGAGVNEGAPGGEALAGNSVSMAAYGAPGPGRWITVYTGVGGDGHEFLEIAGIQLDTSHYGGTPAQTPITDEGAGLPGYAGAGTGPRWEPHSGLAGQLADGMAWSAHHEPGL
jgi:hypothetical protein